MAVEALLQRLQATPPGETLDWRALREEIHDEFERARSDEERSALLAVFKAVMDLVERSGEIPPEKLDLFRETRSKDYNLLIVRECLVGENVSVEKLDAVTQREVAAGRMAGDHALRTQAEVGMLAPHLSHAELIAMASGTQPPPSVRAVEQKIGGWRGLLKRLRLG
jgi:hypothetical protein